ncbi:MAG: hypothetical protein HY887_02170 [Deltaproteobacteria bacterium]|nr:hypothetical protein [Deltaproteobacteria bacterium]
MSHIVVITGIASFSACILLHLLVWRVFRPRRSILLLFAVFFVLPAFFFLILFLSRNVVPVAVWAPSLMSFGADESASVLLMHAALSSAYILTYPAIQAGCPSLRLLLIIGAGMPEGITRDNLKKEFGLETLFLPRIEDLLGSNFVKEDRDKLMLTATGRILAGFFALCRKSLGLLPGKG